MDPACWLILLAGPNGAGKSTFAKQFLPALVGNVPFINVDDLSRAAATTPPLSAVAVGRQAIQRIERLMEQHATLVIETTLSGQGHLNRVRRARRDGWKTAMIYLGLRTPDDALRRVAERVGAGGHDVPEHVVRRRFYRSLDNLPDCVRLVDIGVILDNSARVPEAVASSRNGIVEIFDNARLPDVTVRLASLDQSNPAPRRR